MLSNIIKAGAVAAIFALATGCATQDSMARQEFLAQRGHVYDKPATGFGAQKTDPVKGKEVHGNLLFDLAAFGVGGLAGGATGAIGAADMASYGNGGSMEDRHLAWAFIPFSQAATEQDVESIIKKEWNEQSVAAAKELGFSIVKTNETKGAGTTKNVYSIAKPDIGCPSDLKKGQAYCALIVETPNANSHKIYRYDGSWGASDLGKPGNWGVFTGGAPYPNIRIFTKHSSPFNQLEFYKLVSSKLPDTYLYLSNYEQVWVGNRMVLPYPFILHGGETLMFQTP